MPVNDEQNLEIKAQKKLEAKIATDFEKIEDNQNPNNIPINNFYIDSLLDFSNNTNNLYSLIQEVYNKAKKLHIEIINSNVEPKGLVLKIDPYGLENGKRNKFDGYTYFGYEENEYEKTVKYKIKYIIIEYRFFNKKQGRNL